MTTIRQVNPGEPVRAPDYNAIASAVRTMLNMSGARGISVRVNAGGITVSNQIQKLHFREPAQYCTAANVGGERLNPCSAVMLTWPAYLDGNDQAAYSNPQYPGQPFSGEATYRTNRVVEIRKPLDWCFGRFGITAGVIKAGETGPVFVSGVCIAQVARKFGVTKQSEDRVKKPDRADTVRAETYLQLSEVGAAQVLWILDAPYGTLDETPAVIRFDSRNTTGVGTREAGKKENKGVGEVFEFDPTVELSETYPGVIRIDKA